MRIFLPRSDPLDLRPTNWVLIGMPGAGKSTIGVLLAKAGQKLFLDTDLLIQAQAGCSLQHIVDTQGETALRRIEQQVLTELSVQNTVIATGGSAVYSDSAMQQLRQHGRIIYLQLPLALLEQRLQNLDSRGIARKPGQTLADLYQEREPLYTRYADLTIPCGNTTPDQVCSHILAQLTLH